MSKNQKKQHKKNRTNEKSPPPHGLSPEVPQLLAERTPGTEHHVQGVTEASGEQVLKGGCWLLWVQWLPQLVRDGSYRRVRPSVFFWNAVLHLEGALKLDFELWNVQRGGMGWMEALRGRRILIWMKVYLVEGR